MAESSRVGYMFEQSAVDRERLRAASGLLNQLTSEACVRAGIRPGARAIDVGCGQLGALPVLAEMVGPTGVVVGLESVHLVEADINVVDPAALAPWAPFDIAVCRLLLTHQRDPVATLRAVTRIMRPGGRIIAMEPLRDPGFPRVDPPAPAVERIRDLDLAHVRARGLRTILPGKTGTSLPRPG